MHAFFISNTFISNARLNLAKSQANAKQHSEAELLLFGNYSYNLSSLSSKNNRIYIVKNKQRNKCVCIHEITRLIIIKMKMKMKIRSHRYDINSPKSRHRHKCSKYKKCLSNMLTCIKQHLSNISCVKLNS